MIEQNDEWLVGRRYLSAGSMEPLLEERLHRHHDEEEVPELKRPEQLPIFTDRARTLTPRPGT